jgi:PAS domain S-box-containing protein
VIEVANEAMIEVWGKGPSILGKPLGQALPELKGQPFLQILDDVFTSGKTYEAKATPAVLMVDGVLQRFYFDFSYTPLFNSDGEVFGIIDTAIDVTDKVLAQKKVEESEQNLRNIILHAPVAMCILKGADHVIEIANERMFELWGKEAGALLGKPLFEGLPEVKAQGFEQLLESVYNTGEAFKAYEVPVNLPRANGIQTVLVDFVYEAYREANDTISGIMVVAIEVTEKAIARKKIEESEQQIRSIIESAPFPIGVYTGKEMRIQFANEAILKAWDKGTDVIGKLYAEVLPELSNQEIFEQLDSVYTTGLAFNAKHQQVDLFVNGKLQPYFFNYSFTPLFDPSGNVYGVMNTAADVTDLNLAKIKIEQSERNFRNLVMKAPLAIGLTRGKQMVFESINDLMLSLIGKENNDVIGKPLLEVLPELLNQPINNILDVVYEKGESYRGYEVPISLTKDGKIEERYYNISYTPLPQTGFDLAILHTALDVTEQVINRRKIEASEARFRLMADAMPQFVWTSDVNGNLNYFNQAVYKFSGLTEEQIQNEGWLQIVHPDDREENIVQWMHSIKEFEDFVFHHRFKNKDGEYRWQLSRAIPQFDKDGVIQLWIGTSTDIHEHKLFEEELNKQVKQRTAELESKNVELELINKELEQFTYAASHDMQEPLRKVQTFSSFLLENNEAQLDDRGKNYLKKIGTSVQRIKTIITDLLHYSHQTREEQQFVTTDLNQIIEDVEADMEVSIGRKQAIIVKDKLPAINAVQSQMNQLFSNLFSNALKFSKPGIPLEIKITGEMIAANSTSIIKPNPAQAYLKIIFTDNGIGFEQQYAEQIFSLFKRLHGKTEYEGTGIGLGLCKKIVQNHNGAIWADSVLGEGANFTILLPV